MKELEASKEMEKRKKKSKKKKKGSVQEVHKVSALTKLCVYIPPPPPPANLSAPIWRLVAQTDVSKAISGRVRLHNILTVSSFGQ